jgi:hypothetical protein
MHLPVADKDPGAAHLRGRDSSYFNERMKTHEQNFRAFSTTRSGPRPGTRHRLLYISLLLLAFSANCGVLQGAVPILGRLFPDISGKMDKQAELLVEVQESLLRFADEYSMRMVGGVDDLRRGTDALSRAEVLKLKIAIGSETYSIASGPNAVADLLDMTVFVTVMRMRLENYCQPKVFGKSALPMLTYSRSAEADIWKLTGKVLKPEQETDLRRSIATWHHQNPLQESLAVSSKGGSFSNNQSCSLKKRALRSASRFCIWLSARVSSRRIIAQEFPNSH